MGKYIALLFLGIFMVSCETVEITKKSFACSELDWFEIGRSDGVQGLDSMSYASRKDDCENFGDVDHQKYVSGWYSGIDEFCTFSHGFAYGRAGKKYLNICPSGKEASFMKSYRKGLKVFFYEKDNQKITQELQKISDNAEESDSKEASSIVKRMSELETRLELNKALISEIQKEMDDSRSQISTF